MSVEEERNLIINLRSNEMGTLAQFWEEDGIFWGRWGVRDQLGGSEKLKLWL